MKLFALVFSMMSFFNSCKCNKTTVQEEAKVVNTESNLEQQRRLGNPWFASVIKK